MAPKAKPSKREAILNAMLDVVVERGFHEAPMSLIAERAGASAGVIYHHFASKDAIIQALYERLHVLELRSLIEGYTPAMDPKEAFLHIWNNLYKFHRQHGREMRFLELYKHAGFTCEPDELAPEARKFAQRFRGEAEGGILRDWPLDVLDAMIIGLIARLARQPEELSPALLGELAEAMWEATRARNGSAFDPNGESWGTM